MDGVASADAFQFEGFRLDSDGLFRVDQAGTAEPVVLGSRALDLLLLLVSHHRELVSKDQIMASVWRGMAVEEAHLSVQISALRRILDGNRDQGSCIQTVIGRGYRFVPSVMRIETTRQSMPPAFSDLGEQSVENVARPVRANALSPETVAALPPASVHRAVPRRYRRGLAIVAAIVPVVLVIAGVAWWMWSTPRSLTPGVPTAAPVSQPVVPRLSMVVLPFANLSNDPDQQYFADGITEDLTTDLSRLPNMLVISRNTAFTYKVKPLNAKEIGRELGVRYLLEGSVQRSENQLRVTVQLIDAETSAHLWAERFDRDAGNLFALQNEITSRIAMALSLELVAAEAARPSEKPDVLDYILRGRAALSKPPTREGYAEGIGLLERALAIDPASIDAQGWLANVLAGRVLDGLSWKSDTSTEDIERAEALLAAALAAAPRSPFLHHVKGQVLRAWAVGPFGLDAEAITSRYTDAIPEYEIYLVANPNAVGSLAHLGICKIMTGAVNEAIPLLEKAIRLGPRDPYFFLWSLRIGLAHLLQARISEAIDWLEKSRRANPSFPNTRQLLASGYGLKGETDRAAAELAEFRRLAPDNRSSTIARIRARWDTRVFGDRVETILAGLRKAGLPEE